MPAGPALGILGTLELNGPAGPVRIGAAKERCLLAALAVNAGEVVSRDSLVEALWDGVSPRSAVGALQNYVLRLRRVLESIDGLRIVTEPGGYRLQARPEVVDARLAEQLIADGRAATVDGDAAGAVRLLRAALALWRGPSLVEFADRAFAGAEAVRLDELRESAREELVDAELALDRHRDVSGEVEAMVSRRPLRERRWAQLMLALYRDGRQAEALEAFSSVRRILVDQLGVDPGAELEDLRDRVLRHDPTLDLPRPVAVGSARPADFFGRADELRRLMERYDAAVRGRGNLVTVVGEPGIGKTCLIREFAAAAGRRGAARRCCTGDVWRAAGSRPTTRSSRPSPATRCRPTHRACTSSWAPPRARSVSWFRGCTTCAATCPDRRGCSRTRSG